MNDSLVQLCRESFVDCALQIDPVTWLGRVSPSVPSSFFQRRMHLPKCQLRLVDVRLEVICLEYDHFCETSDRLRPRNFNGKSGGCVDERDVQLDFLFLLPHAGECDAGVNSSKGKLWTRLWKIEQSLFFAIQKLGEVSDLRVLHQS